MIYVVTFNFEYADNRYTVLYGYIKVQSQLIL